VFDPREQIILEEPHVAALHWGGGMAFGLDGYLYLGIGDSERSGRGVEDRNAQNLQTLTGSILRIAIQDGGYDVPPDNPFVGSGNREEIWAYGFRNPWRLSIDPETGALWVADVGHRRVEEVNYDIVRGGNYGWDLVEGDLCFRENPCDQGLVAPLSTYSHDVGCAIVGGVIYRGDDLPELTGRYVFGDYCSGRISFISPDEPEPKPLVGADGQIYALAADEDGEILVLAADGVISRIEPGDGR
jgi:glucose/arabinose dehydrogenase